MASSPARSEVTNEDPTGPLSSASHATITITPHNAEARLAFSEVVDWLVEKSQGGQDDNHVSPGSEARAHAVNYIWWSPSHVRDPEVGKLMKQMNTGHLSSSPSSSFSHSSPADNSGPVVAQEDYPATASSPDLAAYIRTGCYYIDLRRPPTNPARGWTAGRREGRKWQNEFVLCLENSALHGIRQHHGVFQLHETGRVLLRKLSDRGFVEMDGDVLQPRELRVLNRYSSFIRLGQLKYEVAYTRFSNTQEHTENLSHYIQPIYGHSSPPDLSSTPTPAAGSTIQVGQWTLTNAGTVGLGGEGRVSVAVNKTGEVVALKRMSVLKNRTALQRRQNTLETLTRIANAAKNQLIVRLREVITDDPRANNQTADVWFALTPFAPRILSHWKAPVQPDMVQTMAVSLLEAVDFLHANKWIHGDIKLPNIGIHHWNLDKASVVLLDTEDAIYAPQGFALSTPGCSGTVGWLSPEREMGQFDYTTDVWAIGVAALRMLLGKHPWQFSVNPWREGKEFENYRERFHTEYDRVTRVMASNYPGELGTAILQMIRHPYAHAEEQSKKRPSCREVLEVLGSSETKPERPDGPSTKRSRLDG
ncbi:hypothetical protein CEP54_013500 [Fusarium duplospermum]|uniref:Protein kinase domain-containing protein n=1 Tax=Fusarium duplospermum TaxID=1325734 RepID=A0A428P2I9_9HYPO|nr:hypothetical protein CEP54_013500 [Fusarium duplospermum]